MSSGFTVESIDVYREAIFLGGAIAKDVCVYIDDKTGERYLNANTLAQLVGRTSAQDSKFARPWPKHWKAIRAPRQVVKVENVIAFWNDIRPSDAHLSEERFAILFPEQQHPIRKRKVEKKEEEDEMEAFLRLLEEDRKRIAQEFLASLEAKRPQFEEEMRRQILAEHKRQHVLRQVEKFAQDSMSSLSDLQQFAGKK